MEFKYDLFISFFGHDNKPLANEKGWVTNFSRFLDAALERLLKRRPRILLSHDLDSSALAKTPPVEIFSKTAAFISIISPEYIKSKNFQEVEDFVSASQYTGGLEIADLPRVYKVIKSPTNQQPATLRNFWSYELFETDKTGASKEFVNFFDLKSEAEYWLLLVDLAYDIRNLIYAAELDAKKEDVYKGKAVYLAELGDQKSRYHNILKRELQKHGYKVVPDKPVEKGAQNYNTVINDYLNNSALSVHLISDEILQRNADQMIVDAQNSFVSEFAESAKTGGKGDKNFPKLVWVSPDLKPNTEEQKIKIEQLKKEIEAVHGAEIIQTPLEVFKTIVHERARQQFNKKTSRIKAGVKSVYLIHSFADKNNVSGAKKAFEDQGIEVLTPLFEGDILNIVETHRQNLVDCDGVVVYCSPKDTDQWLKSKLIDLQKAPGFGRTKPMLGQSIFIEGEDSTRTKILDKYNLSLLKKDGGFSAESLAPFINKIK